MAMKWNPLTRAFEDDSAPGLVDPNAPMDIAPIGNTMFSGDGGSASPPPAAAPVFAFPPKAPLESTSSTSFIKPSAQALSAQDDAEFARADELNAQAGKAALDQKLAEIKMRAADAEVGAKELENTERAKRQVERQAQRDMHLQIREGKIAEELDAQKKAGSAEADYWKDQETGEERTGAAFLAAVLQGIGAAAQAFQGGSGPSPAERIIDKAISRHRQKMVGAWEATKEARKLHETDMAGWEQERNRIESEADQQSQVAAGMRAAQVEKATAALEPEKAAVVNQAAQAAIQGAQAKDRQAEAQRYEQKANFSQTKREGMDDQLLKPAPLASPNDVENLKKVEKDAAERDALASKIEGNPNSWAEYKFLKRMEGKTDALGEIPMLGPIIKGVVKTGMGSTTEETAMKKGDKPAAEIAVEFSRIVTKTAKGYGGAITGTDSLRSELEQGIQSRDSREAASVLRAQAKAMREEAEAYRRQRTFR